MARRGSFGRVPRYAPSLASMINSIAREMAAQRDSNIMDAWQNGGLFEGKPVTDDMVLAHWKAKMADVSRDDPLYDSYQNAYMQLDYRIQSGRIETSYKQGKTTDNQLAQFYLNWAKKVPKDSEFYRTLQQDAARFLESAKAKGKAARAQAEEDAYYEAQKTLGKKREAAGLLDWALTGIAQVNSLIGSGDSKGLGNLSDPAQFEALIEQINTNPSWALFDAGGVTWTGKMLMDELMKLDPSLKPRTTVAEPTGVGDTIPFTSTSGGITLDWVRGVYQTDHSVALQQAKLATGAGKTSEANAYAKQAEATSEAVRRVGVWGVADPYNQIIAERDRVLDDPTSSSNDKATALMNAGNRLVVLSQSDTIDLRTAKILYNEGLSNLGDDGADTGQPTYGEDYLGTRTKGYKEGSASVSGATDPETGEKIPTGANRRLYAYSANLIEEAETYNSSPEVGFTYAYGKRSEDGTFKFDPSGKGTELGVVSAEELQRSGAVTATVMIEQENGPAIPVTVVGQPVRTVARDENGNEVKTATRNLDGSVTEIQNPEIGTVFKYIGAGGKPVRLYNIPGPNGEDQWRNSLPLAPGAEETDNPDGSSTVDVTGALQGQTPTQYANEPGYGNIDLPGAGSGTTRYYEPKTTAISFSADSAGASSQYSTTSIMASTANAENRQQVMKDIVASPVASYVLAAQEQGAVSPTRSLDQIQRETTLTLSGAIVPGDASEPVWSIGRGTQLVSRESATVPFRDIPKGPEYEGITAMLKAAQGPRGATSSAQVPVWEKQPDRLNPNANPFTGPSASNPLTIRGVTSLRLPSVPGPTVMPTPYATAGNNTNLVAARAAVNPTTTPTVTPTTVSPSTGFTLPVPTEPRLPTSYKPRAL
jgi:hypothetical protein